MENPKITLKQIISDDFNINW